VSTENRQKIPVPRRSFLWSLNETSGEILTHVGPTEFTPSANDRIVRSNDRGGFEQAPMEARPFIMARDGEYVILSNPLRVATEATDEAPNGQFVPGGNKERELYLGTKRMIPGPCAFPLWPGQSAETRPAHKLGANHYLLVEVVGPLDEKARYYRLVVDSAELSSAIIDSGEGDTGVTHGGAPARRDGQAPAQLRLGQRIVVQGRHTQLFIPPSGIEIVPPVDEEARDVEDEGAAIAALPAPVAAECAALVAQVKEGVTAKQFSTMKNELRHRQDLPTGHRAILLSALDSAYEQRHAGAARKQRDRERRQSPADPYARRAVVLGPKEFCILFDADGNPRIVRGPARVFPGPHDTFLQRGSRRRVYDAYELAEHQALWLRVIAPVSRERLAKHLPPGFPLDREHYEAGHELIVRGLPSVFFPFIEAEILNPLTREPHVGNDHDEVIINAIGIDQKSGIYVRDLRTGMVKMIRGETSYLVDPRSEEHVSRRVPRESWNLWVGHAEPHKVTRDDAVTTPWAMSITVPNNEACLITSRHGRRVEIGPKVVLLDYEEQLTPLRLSKGPSKDGHATVTTCFLRVQGARVADTFEVESTDFVRFKVRLGFAGHFEGAASAAAGGEAALRECERWFQVDDPVKLLADTVRARLREATRLEAATRILKDMPQVVRAALFPSGAPLRFEENGMIIDTVDVLSVGISDGSLAELFTSVQREAVRLKLQDEQATRRLDSTRHQGVVDAEEHEVIRAAVKRKSESQIIDAECTHAQELRAQELKADRREAELRRKLAYDGQALDDELRAAERRLGAGLAGKLRDAEASAKAGEALHRVEESHLAAVAKIEGERARAVAEADAVRLAAVQAELVGALHAASDTEVMKAAASNMNLVSLLGGKSPAELLRNVLAGTPLERTARDMAARAEPPVAGAVDEGGVRGKPAAPSKPAK
jgi:hypothetical protein